MKNLPKEKRDRIILIGVGTLAVMFGLYYSVIRYQRESLVTLARQHVDEEVRINNSQRLISGLASLRARLADSEKQLQGIESTMANGDMYSWIIQTLHSFKDHGDHKVEMPQFSRENPMEVGILPRFPYKAVGFYIRGTALYHDLGKFIADFENAFPYMRIQNIQLEPADGTSVGNAGSTSGSHSAEDTEKLAFRLEVVALVNPGNR
ncbi:MAG: hypothetical protein RJA22_1112 [Verrucomicrobiota bacterium]